MLSFKEFFQARREAVSREEFLAVPLPTPEPVQIDYDRLFDAGARINNPTFDYSFSGFFHDKFKPDYTPKNMFFDVASPLTMRVLEDKASAGYDLSAYRYTVQLMQKLVVPCDPWDWHTDADIELKCTQESLHEGAHKERFVLSNICSTTTISIASILRNCPEGLDPLAYYICIAPVICGKALLPRIHHVLEQSGANIYSDAHHFDAFINTIEADAHAFIQDCVKPAPSHIVGFDSSVLHGVTCRAPHSYEAKSAEIRYRLMMTMVPLDQTVSP